MPAAFSMARTDVRRAPNQNDPSAGERTEAALGSGERGWHDYLIPNPGIVPRESNGRVWQGIHVHRAPTPD
jgi:hypothetical protein